jgi:hypothetical protein
MPADIGFLIYMHTSINSVILAQAGIQVLQAIDIERNEDSRLRGNDGNCEFIEAPVCI